MLFIFIIILLETHTFCCNAAKNGYYGSLVPMVRDAFLMEELIRIDCKGLEKSDYKKIGCKLRVIMPRFLYMEFALIVCLIFISNPPSFLHPP